MIFQRLTTMALLSQLTIAAIKVDFNDKVDKEDKWEYFVVRKWVDKTALNPYIEMEGQNITKIVSAFINGIDVDVLLTHLREIQPITLKFNHDNWTTISS